MAIAPAHKPDDNSGSGAVSGASAARAFSGTAAHDGDPTSMAGQYPPGGWGNEIFGGPLPEGTGAPGTQGASYSGATDPTTQPGQLNEGISGLGPADTADTGAPGTATQPPAAPGESTGGTPISVTAPGSYLSGTYQSESMSDDLSGPHDSTQANDQGYATGGPQLPAISGNEPQAGGTRYQPAGGHVMRGGRMNGK